jgi:hypothetical protein
VVTVLLIQLRTGGIELHSVLWPWRGKAVTKTTERRTIPRPARRHGSQTEMGNTPTTSKGTTTQIVNKPHTRHNNRRCSTSPYHRVTHR